MTYFITTEDASVIRQKLTGVQVNEHKAAGVRLAYEEYATGKYSDREIAKLLNERGYRSKTGSPFGCEMVRPMLQNRTYLDEIRYTNYKKTFDVKFTR